MRERSKEGKSFSDEGRGRREEEGPYACVSVYIYIYIHPYVTYIHTRTHALRYPPPFFLYLYFFLLLLRGSERNHVIVIGHTRNFLSRPSHFFFCKYSSRFSSVEFSGSLLRSITVQIAEYVAMMIHHHLRQPHIMLTTGISDFSHFFFLSSLSRPSR